LENDTIFEDWKLHHYFVNTVNNCSLLFVAVVALLGVALYVVCVKRQGGVLAVIFIFRFSIPVGLYQFLRRKFGSNLETIKTATPTPTAKAPKTITEALLTQQTTTTPPPLPS
jgi:hypothetical protein